MIKKFKIGIFTETDTCSEYKYNFYRWLDLNNRIEVCYLIKKPSTIKNKNFYKKLKNLNLKSLLIHVSNFIIPLVLLIEKTFLLIEKTLSKKEFFLKRYFNQCSILNIAKNQIHLDLDNNEPTLTLTESDIQKVNDLNLDLILNCSEEKEINFKKKTVSRYGIISTHQYDSDSEFIGTPGFWETYYQKDKTGYSLIQTNEQSNSKKILLKGFFSTNEIGLHNRIIFAIKSYELFKIFINEITNSGDHIIISSKEKLSFKKFIYPTPLQLLYYSLRVIRIFSKKIYKKILYPKSGRGAALKWNVSYVAKNWSALDFKSGKIFPVPKNQFIADPFLIKKNGSTYCFVEDYIYKKAKGHISVYEIKNHSIKYIGKCLDEEFHLSFPFLFYYKNELYMCPETSQKKEIRVYKSIEFPLKWELAAICMKNVSAADTLLFEYQKKWWLFTNIDSAEINDHTCELHIFYSDSPLSNEWKPHKSNPIYIDPEIARNAGLIQEQGRLIRPAQSQAYNFYGKSTSLFEITKLNESEFYEKLIAKINPDFKKDIIGTHHISSIGTDTVIDHVSVRPFL